MATEQTWLEVPYDERAAAKAAGARWDRAARAWYPGPAADLAALARWAPRPPLPALLPGEDRGFGSGLFVDLIPSSCWFTNVRTCVAPGDWDRVRRMVYDRAGQRCEACGRGPNPAAERRLEAHERWAYDQIRGVQRLRRLIALCSDCHAVTHFGLTALRGRQDWALEHLQDVTGLDPQEAVAHVDAAFALWDERSTRTWSLDLSILTGAGITLAVPPGAAERVAHARRTIAADLIAADPIAANSVASGHPVAGLPVAAATGRMAERQCGCSDPDGDGSCDATTATVTALNGFPPWLLTAPIEQIKSFGANADQMREALLEIRAEADRAHQPAPAAHVPAAPVPAAPVPAAPAPHVPVAPVDPWRVAPPAARTPRRARWWRRP